MLLNLVYNANSLRYMSQPASKVNHWLVNFLSKRNGRFQVYVFIRSFKLPQRLHNSLHVICILGSVLSLLMTGEVDFVASWLSLKIIWAWTCRCSWAGSSFWQLEWYCCWEDSRALLTRAELLCSLADANSAAALAQWLLTRDFE